MKLYNGSVKSVSKFLIIGLVSALTLSACEEWWDEDEKESVGRNLVDRLDTPWEMEFAPDGRLFITERPGQISVVQNGNLQVWAKLDSVVEEVGESGLFGIELDPDFTQNHFVYFAYTYAVSKAPLKLINKIVRYKDNNGTAVFDKVLIDGIPGNYLHNVGALEFGPDGMLYCTVGETFVPELAQDMSSLNGKILRMTREGAIPADNPFPGSYIFSLGHRNPQGIAFQPGTNVLWSTEHGPSEEQGCCRDEVNRILPGKNYGWPKITGSVKMAGYESPVYYSGDTATWAPAGGIFITQGDWQGSLVFTGLRGEALYRAVFDPADPAKIQSVEKYLYKNFGRLRNVVEGSDGKLYIAVSNQDGRGKPLTIDDRIIVMTQNEIERSGDGTTGQSN